MPTITGVSGSTVHGGTLTITGTGFGTKPTAAPLVWDDASSSAADIRDLWTGREPNTTNDPFFHLTRRAPIRDIAPPHSRVGRYLAGCHNRNGVEAQSTNGMNVHFWKRMPFVPGMAIYGSYWHRADPEWTFAVDNDPTSIADNYKNATWTTAPNENTAPYSGFQEYIKFSYGGNFQQGIDDTTIKWQAAADNLALDTMMQPGPSYFVNGAVFAASPMLGWHKYEFVCQMGSTGFLRVYEDGRLVLGYGNRTDVNPVSHRLFAFGGFGRPYGFPTNWRYFTDAYLDTSHARVILGNSPTLNNTCTIREIQVCSAWSDTGITISSFNRGVIDDGVGGYLFVVDGTNVESAGFEIGDAPDPPDPPLPNLVSAEIVPARIPALAGVRF